MVALITGASRGLGLSLVRRFAEEGAIVLATARRPEEAKDLQAYAQQNQSVFLYRMDVSDWESIRQCSEKIRMKFPVIDVIINNAGVLYESDKHNKIHQVDVNVLQNTIAVNVEGPILVLKAFYEFFSKSSVPDFI